MIPFSIRDIAGSDRTRQRQISPLVWAILVTLAVFAFDLIGMRLLHHPVHVRSNPKMLPALGVLLLVGAWVAFRSRAGVGGSRWARRLADLQFTTIWMVTFAGFCIAVAIAGYLSVAANFPLIDGFLVRIDEAVGFHWLPWYRWVRRHEAVFLILTAAYASGIVQATLVPVILGMSGLRREMVQHIARTMLATLIAIAFSTVLPAASAYLHFGITDPETASTVSNFFPLRAGTLDTFDLSDMQGLVSMPSMHVSMAILFAWALRSIPRIALPGALLNGLMIVSAVSQGGHYLVDVLAGVVLAWIVIWVVERWGMNRADADHKDAPCCQLQSQD